MVTVALIPARSQSKRVPHKNTVLLNGHSLLSYSIQSAKDSGIFDSIYVSSDSKEIGEIAKKYGAEFIYTPLTIAHKDHDPDYLWVAYTLEWLRQGAIYPEAFSILRPTSPFRTGETIKRAYGYFENEDCDSIRAVERCSQHPAKMWTLEGNYLKPYTELGLYSEPYQNLPEVWVQNASLEIAHTYVVYSIGNISGNRIIPFFTQGYEGFDINQPIDLDLARLLIEKGEAKLPEIKC